MARESTSPTVSVPIRETRGGLSLHDVQEGVVAIWAQVLRRSDIGLDDDFFDLGGQSVYIVQIAVRVKARFVVDFPMEDLFDLYTPRLLAARVWRLLGV